MNVLGVAKVLLGPSKQECMGAKPQATESQAECACCASPSAKK